METKDIIKKAASHPFISAFLLCLIGLLTGALMGLFLAIFEMGACGIAAGVLAFVSFRSVLQTNKQRGVKITALDKTILVGIAVLTLLIALVSLTPWLTRLSSLS